MNCNLYMQNTENLLVANTFQKKFITMLNLIHISRKNYSFTNNFLNHFRLGKALTGLSDHTHYVVGTVLTVKQPHFAQTGKVHSCFKAK